MVDFVSYTESISLNDYTLILPTVSIGNVPQLTVDLLITSLQCRKVGTIWHSAIVPFIGGDPYDEENTDVCTACEVYVNENNKLALIQLRSSIEFNLAKKFFADLKDYIKNEKFKDVIILTSSFDYELRQIGVGKFYYISNYQLDELKLRELIESNQLNKYEADFDGRYVIHGSGFAVKLYEELNPDVRATVIVKFVSEGDNRLDAFAFLEVLCYFHGGLRHRELTKDAKVPHSWKYVFGGSPPDGIY